MAVHARSPATAWRRTAEIEREFDQLIRGRISLDAALALPPSGRAHPGAEHAGLDEKRGREAGKVGPLHHCRHVGLDKAQAAVLELGRAVDVREAEQRADRLLGDVLAELLLAPAQQTRHLAQDEGVCAVCVRNVRVCGVCVRVCGGGCGAAGVCGDEGECGCGGVGVWGCSGGTPGALCGVGGLGVRGCGDAGVRGCWGSWGCRGAGGCGVTGLRGCGGRRRCVCVCSAKDAGGGRLVLVRGGKHGLQLRHLLHLGRLAGGDGGGGGGRRGSGRGGGYGGGGGGGGRGVPLE